MPYDEQYISSVLEKASLYTAICNGKIPPDTYSVMRDIGHLLGKRGITLRNGVAAPFEEGRARADGPNETDFKIPIEPPDIAYNVAKWVAREEWKLCNDKTKRICAIKSLQILGPNLGKHVDLVVCWLPNGSQEDNIVTSIAEMHQVPIFNLCDPDCLKFFRSCVEGQLLKSESSVEIDFCQGIVTSIAQDKFKPIYDVCRDYAINQCDIYGFFKEFRFLSNFWKCRVYYKKTLFKSVEHAYQAAKNFDNMNYVTMIRGAESPASTKKMGQKTKLCKNWEKIKEKVMLECLMSKFHTDPRLGLLLAATRGSNLCEANYWGDEKWGVNIKTGAGNNKLGKLLEIVREDVYNKLKAFPGDHVGLEQWRSHSNAD